MAWGMVWGQGAPAACRNRDRVRAQPLTKGMVCHTTLDPIWKERQIVGGGGGLRYRTSKSPGDVSFQQNVVDMHASPFLHRPLWTKFANLLMLKNGPYPWSPTSQGAVTRRHLTGNLPSTSGGKKCCVPCLYLKDDRRAALGIAWFPVDVHPSLTLQSRWVP